MPGLTPGAPARASEVRSLYVHVPFCERKCEYCDFVSIAGDTGATGYMAALNRELSTLGRLFPGTVLDTVFIGGGTPSLIDPTLVAQALDTIATSFHIAGGAEISMEANPSSTSTQRAREWAAAGVNRVSIGVQSLHAGTLRYLGRVHDARRALKAIAEVRAARIRSVNCDLIYAVPGLSTARWRDSLLRVVAAGPDHISCYELTIEPGTPLHTRVRRGLTVPAGEETALRQHEVAVEELAAAGFAQYEVSNFAQPGHRCRHNLAYWHNQHYLAAGVGAHGHVPSSAAAALGVTPQSGAVAIRYWHGRGIRAYVSTLGDGRLPVGGWEAIDRRTREVERLLLGLRLSDGIHVDASPALVELRDAGLVVECGVLARVTPRGERVLNAVVERLTEDIAPDACYA